MKDWTEHAFSELFENATSSRKLPRSSYARGGAYPVVDQGEGFIGGWSDDGSLVHPGPLPVLVYGDHTRAVKLLEVPFIQGADGVKVLAPTSKVTARFGAWLLRAFPVASKGYARHFAELRRQRYRVPPLAEQHRVVAAIEAHYARVDAAVASLTRAKANVTRARASVLEAAVKGRLVTTEAALARAESRDYEPGSALLARKRAKRTRGEEPLAPDARGLPEPPEGWAWASLGSIGEWSSGGTPSRARRDYFGGDVPWIKTGELADSDISVTEETLTDDGLAHSPAKLLPSGTLLVAMYGATIGMTGRVAVPAATNQACAALLPSPENASLLPYVWLYLISQRDALRRVGKGGAQPNISQSMLKAWPIPLPPLSEQHRIVAEADRRLSVLDSLATTLDANLARCASLRRSILKRAFEGRLVAAERVTPTASTASTASAASTASTMPPRRTGAQDAAR